MGSANEYARRASPNEQRTISREDCGFYYGVIVGLVYDWSDKIDKHAPETYFYPLAQCLKQNPWLSVVVGGGETDKAFFERMPTVDLRKHIHISDSPAHAAENDAIVSLLEANLDAPFPKGIPPWKLLVLPLRAGECFVALSFSHTLGDGMTGPIFHRVFLGTLREMERGIPEQGPIFETISRPLYEPFDTPERLPISWSFLLKPLIAVLLPAFVANILGIKASASTIDEGTWTGTPMFFDASKFHVNTRLVEIEAPLVEEALKKARQNGARLTGVIHQLITRSLGSALTSDKAVTNFVSQTAVNMRKAVGVPADEAGEFASGCYMVHQRSAASAAGPLSEAEWAAARECTEKLEVTASSLKDQAIGLLRYAPSIRSWTLGKVGGERDASYEMSNVGVFDPRVDGGGEGAVTARKMVFAQPGHVIGPPVCFNVATVKGKSLVITVTWQVGALGVERDEGELVDEICERLQGHFKDL